MDQSLRNLLQRATQAARSLLEQEFAAQLESTYDILPDGTIARQAGPHLDGAGRLRRRKLVQTIQHRIAGGQQAGEAVSDYAREAAFTCLNRFVALKMLEARELVQICVSKGDQSGGFREFCGLAPGLSELADGGYQLYLECLFDELSTEVKVLFDRRDPASLLWPRRQALLGLLEILNQPELGGVWIEDETIGWVYQYFNSQEERRKMRDQSQAPRNSRELAVRNQFFTPRYVVQFLTDNTLGRIWYEMRQGQTSLVDKCEYLVRRPDEVFLEEGGSSQSSVGSGEDSGATPDGPPTTDNIPHRPLKDPRDLKILDPACGSGHFLLYCFDVLQTIYEEAWHDRPCTSSEPTASSATDNCPLATAYPTFEALRAAVPELILRHNLHGIDIDPRCVQIAALALWMRAQRAWQAAGIASAARPPITTIRVVCAAPMPGEESLLQEFLDKQLSATPEDRVLGVLVRRVFGAMRLAGEAGSLLKIEEEIATAVAEAKKAALASPRREQRQLFEVRPPQPKQKRLDFESFEITDEAFWDQAEKRVYSALQEYAEQAERGAGFQRRLFAHDAALGFAFIDVCRQRYDVALMNPPFGAGSTAAKQHFEQHYPRTKNDLYAAFVERGLALLAPRGMLGAITSRTGFFLSSFQRWREEILLQETRPTVFADLGYGVLDTAMVETAAYCLEKRRSIPTSSLCSRNLTIMPDTRFFRMLAYEDKGAALRAAIAAIRQGRAANPDAFAVDPDSFQQIPGSPFAYSVSERVRRLFHDLPAFETQGRRLRLGDHPSDDFRYLRLFWEVPFYVASREWPPYYKGGGNTPFFGETPLVVDWDRSRQSYRAFLGRPGRSNERPSNYESFFLAGLTCPNRPHRRGYFSHVPPGGVFGHTSPIVQLPRDAHWAVCALLNSDVFVGMLHLLMPRGIDGGQTLKYEVGYIRSVPIPEIESESARELEKLAVASYRLVASWARTSETSRTFILPRFIGKLASSRPAWDATSILPEREDQLALHQSAVNLLAVQLYGINDEDQEQLTTMLRPVSDYEHGDFADLDGAEEPIRNRREGNTQEFAGTLLSYVLGSILGRWDIRFATGAKAAPELPDPFAPLPVCSPGMLQTADGLPAEPADVPADYPLRISWPGVLVDDEGHEEDIAARLRDVLRVIWHDRAAVIEQEACEILAAGSIRDYFRKSFFADHIKRYSKSRRKAPIYWELATPSGSYAVWLFYHRFTRDTFYKVLNDFVKPKVEHERRKLARLMAEAGSEPTRSQRAEFEAQEFFVSELKTFQDEVERVAPLWNPDLNDGVIINYAPLWRLVKLRSWQSECKDCWERLIDGQYDWAHLALHLWPERVVPKCRTDRSLAIAHDLEDLFWVEQNDKWRTLGKPADEIKGQKKRRRLDKHQRLRTALAALAQQEDASLTAAELWRQLAAGDRDDTAAALLLWPARVIEKCVLDRQLADKLGVAIPKLRSPRAVENLVKRYETDGCGHLADAVAAALAERPEPYPAVWKSLEDGQRDELALALALWPDRVVDKCAADLELAQAHDLARFFWYDDPWTKTWRRREPPDIEAVNEIAHRNKPAVKAALESLLSAPTAGSSKRRKRK